MLGTPSANWAHAEFFLTREFRVSLFLCSTCGVWKRILSLERKKDKKKERKKDKKKERKTKRKKDKKKKKSHRSLRNSSIISRTHIAFFFVARCIGLCARTRTLEEKEEEGKAAS